MQLYHFYIFVIGLSPFILIAFAYANFWAVIGFLTKLNRWQRRIYARWRAWQLTHKAFNTLWSEYAHSKPISRKAFKLLKHDMWETLYQKNFKSYLSEAENYKHPIELEYEERERYGL